MTKIQNLGEFTQGEILMPLTHHFTDATGTAINLLNFQARFLWREQDGIATTANASVTSPAAGEVTYTFTGPEMASPGHYLAEIWVGNGTNRYCSDRFIYTVRAAVGTVPAI